MFEPFCMYFDRIEAEKANLHYKLVWNNSLIKLKQNDFGCERVVILLLSNEFISRARVPRFEFVIFCYFVYFWCCRFFLFFVSGSSILLFLFDFIFRQVFLFVAFFCFIFSYFK